MFKTYILCYIFFLNITLFYKVYAQLNPRQIKVHEFRPLNGECFLNKNIRKRAAPTTLPPCNEDELMVYLAEIRAINPESIINLSTGDDIKVMCTQVSDSLDKMDEFLKKCRIPQEKDLYIQLIKGVDSLYDYLCNSTYNQEAFQKHYSCYHSLHVEYEICSGPADWTEYEDAKKVCQIYKEVTDCYYIKTAQLCGIKAARIMKDLMKHIIDSILTIHCNVWSNPYVPDAMPESACTACTHTNLLYTVTTAFTIIFNLR